MKYRNDTSGHSISLECWVLPTEESPPQWGQTGVTSRKQQETNPAQGTHLAKTIGPTSKAPAHISPPPFPRGCGIWGHGSVVALAVLGDGWTQALEKSFPT